MKLFSCVLTVLILLGCSGKQVKLDGSDDPNLWLEEIEGEKSLSWVESQNKMTLDKFTKSENYKKLNQQSLQILQDKDKIPYVRIQGEYLYNFWQDEKNVRGLLRRTSLNNYLKGKTRWETVINFDSLADKEKENWVYKGLNCRKPKYENCLVQLSRGGKDAVVVREFNSKTKKFVKDGFFLKEAKTWVNWKDQHTLFVSTDFGSGTLTESGYPTQVRVWKRNSKLEKAPIVLKIDKKHMGASGGTYFSGSEKVYVLRDWKTFFSSKLYIYKNNKKVPLPIQETASFKGFFNDHLIVQLREDWIVGNKKFNKGSLLGINRSVTSEGAVKSRDIQVLYQPNEQSSILRVAISKKSILINVLEKVRGQIYQVKSKGKGFGKVAKFPVKIEGDLKLASASQDTSNFFFYVSDFLTPSSLYYWFESTKSATLARRLPAKFDSTGMEVRQLWANSKDGTKVPYWVVGSERALQNGKAPSLLYGYGGFEVSITPNYSATVGKLWLEKGGVYIIANIRGGGEFGPRWHQAALKKNRHKAYEDFIAVAESLIQKGITSRERLAIMGGSNGGLLVGAVMTKRPDLFKAVICKVPLLDMVRYSQLLAGASWVGEYGDPRKDEMKQYLLSYSPYHNVKKDEKYPETLFMTSTKDDRVHPGHARKMVARMKKLKHPNIYYYENTEGGHAASANLKQKARMTALTYEFLFNTVK